MIISEILLQIFNLIYKLYIISIIKNLLDFRIQSDTES